MFSFSRQPLRARIGRGILRCGLSLAVGAAVCFAGISASSQTLTTGDIAGTVIDSQGRVVSHAEITAANEQTGAVSQTQSTGNGAYHLPLLIPGEYRVIASHEGFDLESISVVVSVATVARANFTMRVGSVSETVHVTGAAPLLDTQNGDLTTTLTQTQLESIPNPGNDVTFAGQLAPGSVMNTAGGTGNFSSYGLPATSNNMTINGASIINPWSNTNNTLAMNMTLGNNELSEATVVSNPYSVQYGGLGGAQLVETTRAGTNQYHGNVAFWWNNENLNGNNYFNAQQALPRPTEDAYQWAAAVGGPIVRNKTLFFADYEGIRFTTETAPALVYLPSASFESRTLQEITSDNPSELPFYQKLFGVYNAAPIPKGQTLRPYNNVNLFTGATVPNPDINQFTFEPVVTASEYLATLRIDHNFSPNDKIYFHYEWDKGTQPAYEDPISPAFNVVTSMGGSNGMLSETHTFGAKAFNTFLFVGNYWTGAYPYPSGGNAVFPYQFNYSDTEVNQNNTVLHYSDPLTPINPDSAYWPQGTNQFQYQFTDDASVIMGRHTLKFGATFLRTDAVDLSPDAGVVPRVSALGDGYGQPYEAARGTGTYFALFDQGYANSSSGDFPIHSEAPFSWYQLGGYVQDEWQVRKNLTLNAGIRIERNSNPVSDNDSVSRMDNSFFNEPGAAGIPYNSVIAGGQKNVFTSYQSYVAEPRASFAWQPSWSPSLVIRGGIGMFADAFPLNIANTVLYNAPIKTTFTANSESMTVPGPQYLIDPAVPGSGYQADVNSNNAFQSQFSSGGTYSSISSAVAAAGSSFATPGFFNVAKKIYYPTYEEWNLQIQNQFGAKTVFSLGYNGNHGYREPFYNGSVDAYWNPGLLPGGTITNTETGNVFRFTPQQFPANPINVNFSSVNQVQNGAISNYHGLTADLVHRDTWLTVDVNYSFSKAMDEISNGGLFGFNPNPMSVESPYNLRYNYGPADYNVTNNFKASYVFNVPGGNHLRTALAGWQVGGDVFWHSGFPFSVVDGFVPAAFGTMAAANSSYPYDGYGGQVTAVPLNRGMNRHCGSEGIFNFNTDSGGNCLGGVTAFTDPTSFGSEDRNQYTGPGYFDTDADILKTVPLPHWEGGRLLLGAQFFNILNHPNFANPSNDIADGPNFGQITSTVSTPTSIFGAYLGGDASPRIIQLKGTLEF
ncbi:MAG TPA: carboxypeptidase regulatory-like domain-containing protein [Acidobacteriaceae bacterium]|nr:carboxypeptidase regulatory-like domain-containing protein [Acidobacteriaceae bacterium]